MSNALLSLFVVLTFSSCPLWGQDLLLRTPSQVSSMSEQDFFKKQVELLNERYKDFFIHTQGVERRRVDREKGAGEKKREREKQKMAYEKVRQDFIRQRKERPDMTKEKLDFEQKLKERAEQREKLRRKFVEHQRALKKMRETAKKIPEKKVLGL